MRYIKYIFLAHFIISELFGAAEDGKITFAEVAGIGRKLAERMGLNVVGFPLNLEKGERKVTCR